MTYLRKILLGFGVVLLAAVALLWFFPARLALALMAPDLHGMQLQHVSGLVWQGQASKLLDQQGRTLGRLHWRISRRALLGELLLQIEIEGPQLAFSGSMRRVSADTYDWRNVRARATLGAPGQEWLASVGQPRGELLIAVDHALLQNGWPLALEATAHWRDGSIRDAGREVPLGDWQMQAQARDGWIKAQFQNEGDGPLRGNGKAQASLLGWRLEATLQPQEPDPALRQWLHRWGTIDANGITHIQRHGGLAI